MLDNNTVPLKICTSCKHIGTNSSGDWEKYRCFAPQNVRGTNMVNGAKLLYLELCKDHRSQGIARVQSCGEEGRWYEEYIAPAPAPTPIPAIKPGTKIKVNDDLLKSLGM